MGHSKKVVVQKDEVTIKLYVQQIANDNIHPSPHRFTVLQYTDLCSTLS